jgi:hypothetical protein
MNSKARDKENNEKPFEYHTNDGVIFTSDRCDFSSGVKVKGFACNISQPHNLHAALRAVAEMIAYHRAEVWPTLNGFSGYDCIHFEEVPHE